LSSQRSLLSFLWIGSLVFISASLGVISTIYAPSLTSKFKEIFKPESEKFNVSPKPIASKSLSLETAQSKSSSFEVQGRAYIVLNSGAKPLSDHEINFASCDLNRCWEIIDKIKQAYSDEIDAYNVQSKAWSADVQEKTDAQKPILECYEQNPGTATFNCGPLNHIYPSFPEPINPVVNLPSKFYSLNLISPKKVRTDIDGKFNFECPSDSCIYYLIGKVNLANAIWFSTVTKSSQNNFLELKNSTAFATFNDK
jgi:hypothetical protein